MTSIIPWLGVRGDVWDPFDFSWDSSRRRRGDGSGDDPIAALAQMKVDWRETEDAHIFRADLPGVKKQEVKVQVEDGNILAISGEFTKEEEDTNDKWHRVERQRGKFTRRFRLPDNAKVDEISCALENGVLNVKVPKKVTGPTDGNVKNIDIA